MGQPLSGFILHLMLRKEKKQAGQTRDSKPGKIEYLSQRSLEVLKYNAASQILHIFIDTARGKYSHVQVWNYNFFAKQQASARPA